jgi:hypothetical protein
MAYEKDQNPTAQLARKICLITMGAATLLVLLLYGVMFESMSETFLVQVSFLWVCAIAFGGGGLLLAHKGLGPALGIGAVIAFAFFLALQTFYALVWPLL